VARFNGGANAGHTVVVGDKKYAFHLLPCGIVYPHTTNLLGNGTVVHVDSLFNELKELDEGGVNWAGRLLISDRAQMLFDFHKQVDGLTEERRAGATGGGKIGTTKQGIGPCYASKAARNGIRFGMLAHPASLKERLQRLCADTSAAYQIEVDFKVRARCLCVVVVVVVVVCYAPDEPLLAADAQHAPPFLMIISYPPSPPFRPSGPSLKHSVPASSQCWWMVWP